MTDSTLPSRLTESQSAAGESVVFFRGSAHYSPIGHCWHLQIRGSIFAAHSRARIHKQALLHLFKRVVKPEKETSTRQRFHDRAHLFLQSTKKGQSVPIAIAERAFDLPDSLPNGHFETTITLQESELEPVMQTDDFGRRFVQFCGTLPDDEQQLFSGEVELIPPEGLSVISDVDDTIKVSNVPNRKELLANTFTREFRSVDGMRNLYRHWAAQGMSFHYVSASPWPLYAPLVDWLATDGFPLGTMHLRHVRLRDLRSSRISGSSFQSKRMAIEQLLRTYPQRRFILCGDSGERDAELYGGIARDFGTQILHIAIRSLKEAGHSPGPSEVAAQLAHLDRSRWSLFDDPRQLEELLADRCAVPQRPDREIRQSCSLITPDQQQAVPADR